MSGRPSPEWRRAFARIFRREHHRRTGHHFLGAAFGSVDSLCVTCWAQRVVSG